jgi:hypothetical protein
MESRFCWGSLESHAIITNVAGTWMLDHGGGFRIDAKKDKEILTTLRESD